MSTVTLTFNLPEDKEEFETTMKAGAMASLLWELDQTHLRGATKYGAVPHEVMQELREEYKEAEFRTEEENFRDKQVLATLEDEETQRFICTVLQGVRTLLGKLETEYECQQ